MIPIILALVAIIAVLILWSIGRALRDSDKEDE